MPKARKPLPEETVNTLVAVQSDTVLVIQRPARGLLAGLWEFPVLTQPHSYAHIGVVTHTFTHKRIHYHVFFSDARVELPGVWIPLSELASLAFSKAQRRVGMLALPVRRS